MLDITTIWAQIQPWVAVGVQAATVIIGGVATIATAKKAISALISRRTSDFNSDSLVEALSEKIVRKIAKKEINVDIKTLLKSEAKQIAAEVAAEMRSEFKEMIKALSSDMKDVKTASVGVADLLVRGREMSDKQKAELLATVVSVRGALPEEPREAVYIELDDQPVIQETPKPTPVINYAKYR